MEIGMNIRQVALLAALASVAAGCANEPRSRDTSNENVSGETLAQQVCSNCHGVTGNSNSPNFPNLAAQPEAYLVGQLTGFKGHSRRDPAGYEYMWGLSHHLTDKQIKELAVYFSAQTLLPQRIEGKSERNQRGETIFTVGIADKAVPPCSSCHGAQGQGNAAFPRIAGQHADYLVKQMTVFQRTDQRPEGNVMKVVAHGLTQENMLDVADYLQSMPGK
ncbi:MAG: c-type cytochrome [Dokdonella sp.]